MLAFPLSIHPGDSVMSPGVDTNLFIWTLAWDAHALVHNPTSLFQANTFHPHAYSLAFSENLLGSSVFAAPIIWLGGSPVLAVNIVALLSIPLSALGAYLLAREVGLSRPAALLAGLVFGFAPPRFFRLDQIHLTTVQWIPFCLAFAHRYLRENNPRDLRISIAFFTAQAVTSGHGAVFLATALAMLAVFAVAGGVPVNPVRRIRDVGWSGVLLFVPTLLVLLPYRRVQDEVDIVRTLADYRVVSWQSFLASPSYVHRWLVDTFLPDHRVIALAGAYLFPGILPIVLAIVALAPRSTSARSVTTDVVLRSAALFTEVVALIATVVAVAATISSPLRWRVGDIVLLTIRTPARAWLVCAMVLAARIVLLRIVPFQPRAQCRAIFDRLNRLRDALSGNLVSFYGVLTGVSIWLSVAPPIGLWPHVYWLPGFNFIRAPSRFMILGVLGLAVLGASGFDRATRRMTRRARILSVAVVAALMLIEFAAAPLGITPDPAEIPAIDRWLANSPRPLVIAEVPVIEAISEHDMQNSLYMRHSMAHWHKTVHGYSGVHPPLTDGLYEHLLHFPSDETIRALKSVGVDTVVVHVDGYPAGSRDDLDRQLTAQSALRLEHVEGDGRVYAIR